MLNQTSRLSAGGPTRAGVLGVPDDPGAAALFADLLGRYTFRCRWLDQFPIYDADTLGARPLIATAAAVRRAVEPFPSEPVPTEVLAPLVVALRVHATDVQRETDAFLTSRSVEAGCAAADRAAVLRGSAR